MRAPDMDRLVPAYVRGFQAYVPSKPDAELMRLFRVEHLYRLNNNENPLGPSPRARQAIAGFAPERAGCYPSGDAFHLRMMLAGRLGVDPDQILVGNGANEVIAFAIKAFCEPGDNIVTADKTFAVYEWVATFSGLEARLAPLKDFCFDDQALLQRLDARSKIVFICNPNNPTGTWWDQARLRRFLEMVDGRQIVVVDEAYCEFVESPDFPDGVKLIGEFPNLVVFRTFSKMFGLAGLRIGYLVGSPGVVAMVRRTCVVYSVNVLAQEAALAALEDADHQIMATRALVRREKSRLLEALAGLGIETQAGEGCFVMAKLPMSDTLAYRRLMGKGVMIRSMTGFRFPNWIRISIGLPEAMEAAVKAMASLLEKR